MDISKIINLKDLDKGKKIVLFGFIPFFLLILSIGLAYLIINSGKEAKELEENPYKNINIDVVEASDDETLLTYSKTEAYRKRTIEENLPPLDTSINLESPYDMMAEKQKKLEEQAELKSQQQRELEEKYNTILTGEAVSQNTATEKPITKTQNFQTSQKYPSKKTTTASTNKQESPTETKSQTETSKEEFYSRYNYSTTNKIATSGPVYAEAFLERDTKIKNGSEPVFILQNDCTINGIEFKKMSYLFSKAEMKQGRLYINVRKVLDTNNKEHYVNLSGYNENLFEGLAYDDSIEEAMTEGKEEVIDELVDEIPYHKSARTLSRSINKLKKKDDYIILPQGFIMKFLEK